MNELKKEYYSIGNGHFNYNNKANVIINSYNGNKEIIYYKKEFVVPNGCSINSNIDRTRKFFYNNGVLQPKKQLDNLLESLQNSLMNSRKRSLDNIYSYALCNDWKYFITLTFNTNINRFDIDAVNYSWQKFKQKMQYYFPNIKILLIPEGHPTSGAIHFHGLIGEVDLDKYLIEARNNKKLNDDGTINKHYGEILKTNFGYQIYNFIDTFYTSGFSTVVKIDPETPKKRVVNYLIKYISKEISNTDNSKATNIRYNKKSYYHTRNLISKEKKVCYFTEQEFQELVNADMLSDVQKTKDNDKFVIYEIKNTN